MGGNPFTWISLLSLTNIALKGDLFLRDVPSDGQIITCGTCKSQIRSVLLWHRLELSQSQTDSPTCKLTHVTLQCVYEYAFIKMSLLFQYTTIQHYSVSITCMQFSSSVFYWHDRNWLNNFTAYKTLQIQWREILTDNEIINKLHDNKKTGRNNNGHNCNLQTDKVA